MFYGAHMPAEDAPLAYSLGEVAKQLGDVSRDTVERLIASGRLKTVRVGPRRIVVPRAELVRFLEEEAA